jgi:glycosyltransferase involved in cell wall biosynthesis
MPVSATPARGGDQAAAPVQRRRPGGILLYGMYDISSLSSAPRVRIAMMTGALSRQIHTERIVGGRLARAVASVRWLASGGPRRVGAVYVESATTSAMPTDLAFLFVMRLLRKPVGVYFRDAYQLFREVYPRTRRQQILSDWLWRLTTPLLKVISSVRYAPSIGLARVLGLSRAVMLPPGADPATAYLGMGDADVVGTIVQVAPRSGLDRLVAAMELVRKRRPDARLRVVARSIDEEQAARLPAWMEVIPAGRSSVPDALAGARVAVLPLPVNAYTDLAVAVRLFDFLALGKPIVATDAVETRAIMEASGAGMVTDESAEGMAAGILALLEDEALASRCSTNARAYACSASNTWDARATTVLETLGLTAETVS